MTKNHSFKNGQSLLELAVFATVMFTAMGTLVSYAMSFNFTQRLAMLASKRVNALAAQVGTIDSYFNANVNLIYDKAVPDTSSMFGIPKKTTLSVSASGVRSNELYAEPDWGNVTELSRVLYDINGKVYTFLTSAYGNHTFFYTLYNTTNNTTKNYTNANGNPFKKKDWKKDWWKGQNPDPVTGNAPLAWEWIVANGSPETEIRPYSSWDINDDGSDELIVSIDPVTVQDNSGGFIGPPGSVNGPGDPFSPLPPHPEPVYQGADDLKFIDYGGGTIDSSEGNPDLEGGLISEYYEEAVNKNSLSNYQKGGVLSTITNQKNLRIVERYVRLNVHKGPVDFADPADSSNLVSQIKANNPGCTYGDYCACSSNLPRDCDCIGTKEDVVRGLYNLYPKYPVDIQGAIDSGSLSHVDVILGSGEVLHGGKLRATANILNKQREVVGSEPVDLIAGNLFLVIRSVFAQDKNAYMWTRDLRR